MVKHIKSLVGFIALLGLTNLSLGDSLNVRWVGSWSYGGAGPISVGEIKGTPYAFLGSGGGIIVFDVSNPSSPVKMGEVGTPGGVGGLFFLNNRIYVANVGGLRIYDASDPSSPLFLGNCSILPIDPLNDKTIDVWVEGNYAYVAGNTYGLQIVDVSNPSSPKEVGHYDTPGQAFAVSVQGDYAYIADRHGGLRIIDVSDPSHPEEVGVWIPWWDTFIYNVFVSGDYAYLVCDTDGLLIIDISNPSNPEYVGGYIVKMDWYWKVGIWVSENLAYFTSQRVGLLIIDVSNPEEPKKLGEYPMLHWVSDIWVHRHHAYVTTSGEGIPSSFFYIIDVSNPSSPEQASVYIPPQMGFGAYLDVSDNYAYITKGDSLLIIDISDQTKPKKIATSPLKGYRAYGDMELHSPYLYFSTTEKESKQAYFQIIDISDPLNPEEMRYHPIPSSLYCLKGMQVSGDYLYGIGIKCRWNEPDRDNTYLCIFDISNPLYPENVCEFRGGWRFEPRFCISGDYIYIADETNLQIRIIDARDLEEPKEVGSYYPSEDNHLLCVDAADNYLYAWGINTEKNMLILEVIDISDPLNPEKVGFVEIPRRISYATEVKKGILQEVVLQVSGSYAYATFDRLWVIDVSDPTNPVAVGFHDVDISGGSDMKIIEKYIYTVGFRIFEFYGGGGVEEKSSNPPIFKSCNLTISPNPCKGVASIEYQVVSREPISLEVYNACGRLVRTLARVQSPEPKAYTITWDGKDDKGEEAPQGIYFIQLRTENKSLTRKVVLVK